MGIFKRKAGGTFVGNLFRKVVKGASGGILGNGAMMLPDTTTQSPDIYVKPQLINTTAAMDIVNEAIGSMPQVQTAIKNGIWNKYKTVIISAGAAILLLISYLLFKKKPNQRRK